LAVGTAAVSIASTDAPKIPDKHSTVLRDAPVPDTPEDLAVKSHHRTLKKAIDVQQLRSITSDELIAMGDDDYFKIRRAATDAWHAKRVHFVCARCEYPVYAPRSPRTLKPLWRHRPGAPTTCEWWTGTPLSVDAVSADQFQGLQESMLHRRVKHAVADMLEADRDTQPGSVVRDLYLAGLDGCRRPDVRATVASRDLAFEIQLATTQLPIIVAREHFYARARRWLLWLTWDFDAERPMRTSFSDIFYSHAKNLFSLDEEVLAKAAAERRFLLRAFWKDEVGSWQSKICGLDDLSWPEGGLPFAVGGKEPWHLDFRKRWMETLRGRYPEKLEQLPLMAELGRKLDGQDAETLAQADVDDVIDFLLSVHFGFPVASAQDELRALFHTFVDPPRRQRLSRLAKHVLKVAGRVEVLCNAKVAAKLERLLSEPQDTRHTIAGRAALILFPEWF
jgi:hypothetical protein